MFGIEITNVNNPSRVILFMTTSIAAAAMITFWIWKKRRVFEPLTGEFNKVGKIATLIIYPVKSLPGIEIDSAECTPLGLKFGPFRDRQWLIVKKNGSFIHQRVEPTLALTKPSFHNDQLWIDAPGMKTLKLTIKKTVKKTDKVVPCRVWGGDIRGVDCGDEASEWFNMYLNHDDLRLVQYVDDFEPRVFKRASSYFFPDPVGIVYHDDGCFHVFTEKSLEDLNNRLKEKLSFRSFRPSILVSGTTEPYAEDNWKFLKTGGAVLMFTIPCGRCVLTTVNPDTGEKTEREPLDTLKTYRKPTLEVDKKKYGQSPLFGIYMGSYRSGMVKKDDSVFAVVSPRY